MTDLEALKAQISDEADLCRNEGATDIAALLDDTRYAIETQAREIERLREELMQIEVDAMEYYNDWMEHGCEQVEATRFAFDLGQYARAALAGDSHDQ